MMVSKLRQFVGLKRDFRLTGCPACIHAGLMTLLILAAGCSGGSSDDSPPVLPVTHMQIGSRQFTLEMATTPGEQSMGLMRRDDLPVDRGMIFIFPQSASQTFWNHDVRFPLDNLFIDDSGNIVSIQHMDAYNDNSTNPVTCRYVIELNSGMPATVGVKVGDHLDIPADAKGN